MLQILWMTQMIMASRLLRLILLHNLLQQQHRKQTLLLLLRRHPLEGQQLLGGTTVMSWMSPSRLFAMFCQPPEPSNNPEPEKEKRAYKRSYQDIITSGGNVIKGIPGHMEAVSSNHQSRIKKKAKGYDNIMAATHINKQFNWNDEARTYLAAGMMQVPAASFYGLARALPFFFTAMLIASSIVINADSLMRHRKLVSQMMTKSDLQGSFKMK